MKKTFIATLLLINICFIACKKNNELAGETTRQKLLGRWDNIADISVTYHASSNDTFNNYIPGGFIEFLNSGNGYLKVNNNDTDTFNYHMQSDSSVYMNIQNFPIVYEIKALTDTSFQLVFRMEEGSSPCCNSANIKTYKR